MEDIRIIAQNKEGDTIEIFRNNLYGDITRSIKIWGNGNNPNINWSIKDGSIVKFSSGNFSEGFLTNLQIVKTLSDQMETIQFCSTFEDWLNRCGYT